MQLHLICALSLFVVAGAVVADDQQQQQQQQPLRQQQQQQPNALTGWLNQLRSYLPSAEKAKTSVVDQVVDSARAKAASVKVSPLTLEGWRATLHPSSTAATGPGEPEEWWVLVTGGNRTCLGGREDCVTVEKAFNESALVFAAASSTPHQAILDCDAQAVLCASWSATPPSLWHLMIPRSPDATIDLRIIPLNSSTITTTELVKIYVDKTWQKYGLYQGLFHPFDGLLAKSGLALPYGYLMSYVTRLPTWAPLVIVSLLSRSFMARRFRRPQPRRGNPVAGQRQPQPQ